MLPPNVRRLRLLVTVEVAFLAVTVLAALVDVGLLSTSAVVLTPFGGSTRGRHVLTTLGLLSVVLLAYATLAVATILVVWLAMRRLIRSGGGHRALTVCQAALTALACGFVLTDFPSDLQGWVLAAVFVALPVGAVLLLQSRSVRAHAGRMTG